jgi:IS1 family transposase
MVNQRMGEASEIRVELIITEHFSIFSSLISQIEQFLCHWTPKLEGYKCSLRLRSKGAMQKTQEEEDE